MTFRLFYRRYWRIMVAAVLVGALTFMASFAISPKYVSTTRMLLVEGSTTSLDSTGQPLGSDSSAIDASGLAQTLSETQAGLVSSREVAVMVVNQLKLNGPQPSKGGPIHAITHALSSTYSHLKAYLTYGKYVTLPNDEKAIQGVQASVGAIDLAPAGGPDTGQADSFILEIEAVGSTALQSQQIANAASQALITISQQRFAADSQAYANALATQLTDANSSLTSANAAVSNYETSHNITAADIQAVQNLQNPGTLASQQVSENAAVQGDTQTVASLKATLATITPTETSSQNITTGRSSTGDSTTEANPVYQTVEEQLAQAKAALASDSAQASSLKSQLSSAPGSTLTQSESALLDLEEQVTADQNSVQSLSTASEQANTNIQIAPVELSQLGGANLPEYPSSPKRDLYLLLGLLIGGLAGTLLTYQAQRRKAMIVWDDKQVAQPRRGVQMLTPNDPITEPLPLTDTQPVPVTGTPVTGNGASEVTAEEKGTKSGK